MNIYCVAWVQDDAHNLSAVVVAIDEDAALRELDLDTDYCGDMRVGLLGNALSGPQRVVCRESL